MKWSAICVTHTVTVPAASLYEAAALGVAEFRRCGMIDAEPGIGTTLSIRVEAPATEHELPVAKLMAWLEGGGRSPAEQALKARLRAAMRPSSVMAHLA